MTGISFCSKCPTGKGLTGCLESHSVSVQEAAREHDRALRQVRAKVQRTETDLRAARQQAAAAAARASELEGASSQKDLQLDAAVQQARPAYMQLGSPHCI